MTEDPYLIWSPEHQAWWGPGGFGYRTRVSEAGRFTRDQALNHCVRAIPGTAARIGMLPELPVRLADVAVMMAQFHARFPDRLAESDPWL